MKAALREEVFERDGYRCQYCRKAQAVHVDHLIPIGLRRYHHLPDDDERFLTSACLPCNLRKGTRRLIPRSLAHLIPELPGKGWRTWNGDPAAIRHAYRG